MSIASAIAGGSGEPVCVPTLVEELYEVDTIEVSCGRRHAACLDASGLLYTWGEGGSGELGLGDRADAYYPSRVSDLDQLVCVQVSCGSHHTAAVTDAGELFCWGSNEFGAVGVSDRRRTSSRSPRARRRRSRSRNRQSNRGKRSGRACLSDSSGNNASTPQSVAVLSPRQVQKFGRDGLKVESVEAGVHETLVVTRPMGNQ